MTDNKQPFLVQPGESRGTGVLDVFGSLISIKMSGRDTGGGYSVFEGRTMPQEGPPLHRHLREDEFFYVLEGHYRFEVDGKTIFAGPGASVFAPRGSAHTFQNVGTTPGRMLGMTNPSGLDEFFTEVAAKTQGMKEPDVPAMMPLFQKYGVELLGPPVAARPTRERLAAVPV
jgi:mannose-6-phosphate isomerase-like protein (cupin superfamily)